MRKPLALVAAVLLSTSLAAACGDDDGDDDAAATTTTEVAGDDDSTTTTAGGAGDGTTTTAAGDGTDGPIEGSNPDSEYCQAAQVLATDQTLADLDFTDPEQTAHAIDLLTGLRDAAPDEVRPDVQTVVDAFQAVADAFAEAGDDAEAQAAALTELQGEFAESLGPATQHVQTFTQEQCGIDVSGEPVG